MADMLAVSTEECGIVLKTALGKNLAGLMALLDQLLRHARPAQIDIFSDGSAGGGFEAAIKLGAADEKFGAQRFRGIVFLGVLTDVAQDLMLRSLLGRSGSTLVKQRAKMLQKADQTQKDI